MMIQAIITCHRGPDMSGPLFFFDAPAHSSTGMPAA
jgi:hypothetical protein